MLKKILLTFIVAVLLLLTLSSCVSDIYDDRHTYTSTEQNSDVSEREPLGYNFTLFDSDGDGIKSDIAKLDCVDLLGGYGTFTLEIFASGKNSYSLVFDSTKYTIDEATYEMLSANVEGDLLIDTFYSAEALDTDSDGCEELVCRQYAWVQYHSNHVGDVVTTFKITDNGLEISDVRFEKWFDE